MDGLNGFESLLARSVRFFGLSLGTPGLFRVSGDEIRPNPGRRIFIPSAEGPNICEVFGRMFHSLRMVSDGLPSFK